VMGILLVPYLSWLARHGDELARFYAQVAPGTTRSFAAGAVEGLGAVLRVLVYYAGPLGLVFLALFPGVYRVRREPVGQDDAPGQLVERTLLWGLALLIAGALLNLLGQLKFRWAIPLFFLLPLYGCWRADRLAHDASWRSQRLRIYAGMLFLTEGLIVAGILLQVHMGARVGVPSRLNMPYDAVARSLAATGFRQGTIVAGPGPLGGNLRIAFPHARVASLETPGYLAPAPASGGECLVVWDRGSGDAVPEELRSWLEARLAVELPVTLSVAGVTASYRHTPASVYRAFYVHLPRGAGLCR
jgi:hypothetical protein